MKKILYDTIIYAVVLAALVAIWAVASAVVDVDIVLPSPLAVIVAFGKLFGKTSFYRSFGLTLLRTVVAFVLSAAVALVLAICAKCYPVVGKVVAPIVTVLRTVPTLAVILIVMMLLSGSANVSVAVSFLIVFPVCYSAFSTTLNGTAKLDEMCKVFEVTTWDKISKVYLPTLLPQFAEQTKTSLPLSLKVVIAGEVLAFPSYGIGREMYKAQMNFDTATLFAYTLVAIVVSFAVQVVVTLAFYRKPIHRRSDK